MVEEIIHQWNGVSRLQTKEGGQKRGEQQQKGGHMQGQDFTKYLAPLEGMSYREWIKLKYIIDTEFHKKEHELQKELKLVNTKDLTL